MVGDLDNSDIELDAIYNVGIGVNRVGNVEESHMMTCWRAYESFYSERVAHAL